MASWTTFAAYLSVSSETVRCLKAEAALLAAVSLTPGIPGRHAINVEEMTSEFTVKVKFIKRININGGASEWQNVISAARA